MYQRLIDNSAFGVVRTGQVLLLLAVVVCCIQAAWRLRRVAGVDWYRARWGFLFLAIAPWIGGHVHFLINNWSFAAARPMRFFLPWMGLHAGGVIVTLAVLTPVIVRHYGLPLGRVADALVPTLGLGIIIGRLGCFVEGCCFGRPCAWPWCLSFPHGSAIYEFHVAQGYIAPTAARSEAVHPLQLYFAAVGLFMILLARWLEPRKIYAGQVALAALLLFSVGAAALEFFREDYAPRVYWGPLPQLEWTALAMVVACLIVLRIADRRHAHGLSGTVATVRSRLTL